MKEVLNLIITVAILAFFAWFFPELVKIDGTKTLLFAAFLLFVAEMLVMLVIVVMMFFSFISGNLSGIFAGIIAIFFAEIFALGMVDAWLPGITIDGLAIKCLMAIVLSVFRIPTTNNNY